MLSLKGSLVFISPSRRQRLLEEMKREKQKRLATSICALNLSLLFIFFFICSLFILLISGGSMLVLFGALVINVFQFIFSLRGEGYFQSAREKCFLNTQGKCVSCSFAMITFIGFAMVSAYYASTVTILNGREAVSTLQGAPKAIVDSTFLNLLDVRIPANLTTTITDPHVTPLTSRERYYCISPIFPNDSDPGQDRVVFAWAGVILEDNPPAFNRDEACNNAIFVKGLSPSWTTISGNVSTISYDFLCRLETFWYSEGDPINWMKVKEKALSQRNFSTVVGAPILKWGTSREGFKRRRNDLFLLLIILPSLLGVMWLASLFSVHLWSMKVSNHFLV